MNDKIEKDVYKVQPLKKICMTIGELPSSYLETMTYYEMLIWFTNFLRDNIIPTVNNNAEAVKELQNLFTELQNYVNDYFDNLDVQEEINNKLDDMMEAGTLQEIITSYLNSKALFGFDTINDLKGATNLIDGSYARTLGYHTINDGGDGLYKIVDDNTLVADNGSIIALNNGLFAKLVVENNTINLLQFGLKGNGIYNDFDNMVKAFNYANQNNFNIISKANKIYYIDDITETIPVKVNVNLNNSKIIINDVNTTNKSLSLFNIVSNYHPININTVSSISKNQDKIEELSGNGNCLAIAINSNKKDYIRYGSNADNGKDRIDCFRIDNNGYVLDDIIWDFDEVTSLTLYPIDKDLIRLENILFETLVNKEDSDDYYKRNILVNRSNVVIENIKHTIIGESDTETSCAYYGFIEINKSSDVLLNNCFLSAHKTYYRNNVAKGSYDLTDELSINIKYKNITQLNSIMDKTLWGIHGGNGCKNTTFDKCIINRVDAHRGIHNININDCIIGYSSINLIGSGKANITNTTVLSHLFIILRSDYGSTWNGDINIKNCEHHNNDNGQRSVIILSDNPETHDFGYKCYAPRKINIDNLVHYDNTNNKEEVIFYNSSSTAHDSTLSYNENVTNGKYPYIFTKEFNLSNIKVNNDTTKLLITTVKDISNNYTEDVGSAINKRNMSYFIKRDNTIKKFNTYINIHNCDFGTQEKISQIYSSTRNSFFGTGYYAGVTDMTSIYAPVIRFNINNCDYLQLSTSGRAIEWNIKNSTIYLASSGGTDCNYGYYNIDNSKLCYRYTSTPSSSNACFDIIRGMFTMNNCKLDLQSPYTLSDIYTVEAPFRSIYIGEKWVEIFDNWYNLIPWENFYTELDSISSYVSMRNDFGIDSNMLLNTYKRNIPRKSGITSNIPTEIPIRLQYLYTGQLYYDTTQSTLKMYNGSNWVKV